LFFIVRMSAKTRKVVFGILFVLGIFVLFFVSREFNPITQKREFKLTTNGVTSFKKGLDIDGWTRLIYKIDYSTYENLYKNDASALKDIKDSIKTILLKKIDKRISWLWVSDYSSYEQTIKEDTYIVVEIWGISDLDYAKQIIWKTVELEFKLPNKEEPSPELLAERKNRADLLLVDVLKTPEMMEELTKNKSSENIEYNIYSWVNILQLPQIYQDNIDLLNSVKEGEIYPKLIEWTYHTIKNKDWSWNDVELELNGYTFFHVIAKNIEITETPNVQDLMLSAEKYWKTYKQDLKKDINIEVWSYKYTPNELIYNLWMFAEGQKAYKVLIYSVPSVFTTWNIEDIENIKDIKKIVSMTGVQFVHEWWLDKESLKTVVTTFEDQKKDEIKIYKEGSQNFLVNVSDIKTEEDKLYQVLVISDLSDDLRKKIEFFMKEKTLYTIEDVFVYNKEVWVPAVDSVTNQLLNGAYFKFASIWSTSLWAPAVNILFNDQWKEIFCNLTKENIWEQMAIFVWGDLKTQPVIRSQICDGNAIIEWNFSPEEAKALIDDLNDWTVPAPLISTHEETIDPTLWANALNGALIAAVVGVIAIVLLILFMYWRRESFVTFVVLLIFIVTLAMIMKLIDFSLSLSGIAAIILSIWMGVDANILIFERVREELKNGKTLMSAIETWYTRSLSPIRDWNISTWIIAFLLFSFGINMFKWFGSMMLLNIILILLINVPLTKILLQFMFRNKKISIKK